MLERETVCVRERHSMCKRDSMCVDVCVCVCERERESVCVCEIEIEREFSVFLSLSLSISLLISVCVCLRLAIYKRLSLFSLSVVVKERKFENTLAYFATE